MAGLLWGARLGVQFSLSLVVLKALPVLVLGGFGSILGAIVGGLLAMAEPAASPPRLHPNLAEVYRQEIASLAEALQGSGDAEAKELVRGLVEIVTLHPDGDGLRVEVRGALAAILALGRGGDAVEASLARQMKMVAGTGFEPVTFRL